MRYPVLVHWPDGKVETKSLFENFRGLNREIDGTFVRPSMLSLGFELSSIESVTTLHKAKAILRQLDASMPIVEMTGEPYVQHLDVGPCSVDVEKVRHSPVIKPLDDPPELSILIGGWYWVKGRYRPLKAKVVAAEASRLSFVVEGPSITTSHIPRSDIIACVLPEDWPVPFFQRLRSWFASFCSMFS